MNGLSLDVKLAWRMLRKSPGLTVVGALGIALGIAVGVGFFVVLSTFVYPTLPLEEGDRVVALANWDVEANRSVPASPEHFAAWRDGMRSVQQVAAAATGYRALVTGDAPPQAVRAAEMTAAGFQLARVPPLLGRYLVADDERAGAPHVAVLGYDLWQGRFAGDPGAIGRRVLVGGVEHAVVGVMPPGFALPKSEELWTPLRVGRAPSGSGGPALFVFGRLAPGATRERAQAELTTIGRRAAATAGVEADGRRRPTILPYTFPLENVQAPRLWQAARIQLMVSLLLLAIAVNIAVLVFARTAMREGEIVVRIALGASRRRIVAQLFVEALVLSALGAALGLASAHVVLQQGMKAFERDGMAFWVDYGLQPRSVAYAVALAVLSAVVVGVVPGLKATGRRLDAALRRLGGGASVRLGRAWTALIVAQVAVAVAVLPAAVQIGSGEIRRAAVRATFPAHEYLTSGLAAAVPLRPGMDGDQYRREVAARFADRLPELERRLEAEPAVAGVTFEGRLPGRGPLIEVEGVPGVAAPGGRRVLTVGVAPDYFAVLGARVLAGRDLRASDAGTSSGGVVVSEAFARQVLGGGASLGRRIRFVPDTAAGRDAAPAAPSPWLEIVGVVEDLQASPFDRRIAPSVAYYAIAPGDLQTATLLVRVRGDAGGFAPRLRRLAATLDADLRLGAVENLATVRSPRYLAVIVTVLSLVLATVVLLSAAGIHALMSLTVTRRRREIGIRTALGAHPARLLATIFSRAARQLGLGGLLGSLLGAALLLLGAGRTPREAAMYVGGVVVLMLMAGLAAAAGPARRGLRIQPMEALREE